MRSDTRTPAGSSIRGGAELIGDVRLRESPSTVSPLAVVLTDIENLPLGRGRGYRVLDVGAGPRAVVAEAVAAQARRMSVAMEIIAPSKPRGNVGRAAPQAAEAPSRPTGSLFWACLSCPKIQPGLPSIDQEGASSCRFLAKRRRSAHVSGSIRA
jgi:hypothetical protein